MSNDKKKRELIKIINKLSKIRGSGTELISLYVPAGYPITEVVNKLRSEHGQAGNIKSKTTRSNVQDAIDKIVNYLKFFKSTPKNGLAIFCGNVSRDPGKVDIKLYDIEPPLPLQVSIYRCDSEFLLDPLLEQGKVKERYGLVTIDGKEATIGVLEGNVTKILKRLTTTGPSKSTKGGSCIREDAMIQLENGTIIPISQVREGDKVLTYDFNLQKYKFSTCNAVMKRTAETAYRIITKHPRTEIVATSDHLFFIKEEENIIKEKYVDELKVGDRLVHISNLKIKGKKVAEYLKKSLESEAVYPKIVKIEKIENPKENFYDLSIPETENFVVNGITVHNSAARYQRFVEELIEDYYKRVGEAMNETLIPSGIKKVIVGGPGPVKENFLKMKPFNYQFQILAVLDTGYVDDYGIQELARKSVDIIAEEKAKKQKKLMEQFFGEVAKNGLAVYGPKETIEAMNQGKVEILLLSEGLEVQHFVVECDEGQEDLYIEGEIEDIDQKSLKCSNGNKIKKVVFQEELFDEAYEKAEKHGVEVELIPADSSEGKQFLAGFKGIGGILRYK